MIFIILVIALVIYLAISFFVVRFAVKQARASGRRPWVWGGLAAFVMYNLVFWDWIPTVVAHKYYCANEAGFWVYKTLDEWNEENPGVMETLKPGTGQRENIPNGNRRMLDERFSFETHIRKPIPFIETKVFERKLIDTKNQEILYKEVEVGSGGGHMVVTGELKFWLNQDACSTEKIWDVIALLGTMRENK